MIDFHALPVSAIALVFLAAGGVVWFAGTQLAIHGDELAERFNLTREFVGLIFLATATELPEIVTTITAAQVDNAALVLGNMFGGVTMQTAILAVADFFAVRHALTSWPRKPNHALLGVLLIVLLSGLLAVVIVGDVAIGLGVGVGAVCLTGGYPLAIALLRRFDEMESWAPVDLPGEASTASSHPERGRYLETSDRALLLRSAGFSFLILVAGVILATSADALAETSGLGSSFVGVSLLAAATSLPELSTTLAAARLGAYTMAISNIFGSNLIMLALILPADLAYRAGPILNEASASAQFSIVSGIAVTAIYVAGLLIRHTPSVYGAGLDSWLVMAVYLGSLVVLFQLS